MNIEQYQMTKVEAFKKWKEYNLAVKSNPKDRFLQDMKGVYNQLKCGRKIIDFYKVFKIAGVKNHWYPKLAISPANLKIIYCRYYKDGKVSFKSEADSWRKSPFITVKHDPLPEGLFEKYEYHKDIKTIVPKIPASLVPKGDLSRYCVLWEVENWEDVPKDPYLLRRLTPNIFVILSGWDLTELERSVIAGRAW